MRFAPAGCHRQSSRLVPTRASKPFTLRWRRSVPRHGEIHLTNYLGNNGCCGRPPPPVGRRLAKLVEGSHLRQLTFVATFWQRPYRLMLPMRPENLTIWTTSTPLEASTSSVQG